MQLVSKLCSSDKSILCSSFYLAFTLDRAFLYGNVALPKVVVLTKKKVLQFFKKGFPISGNLFRS